MKKLLAIILSLCTVFALTACNIFNGDNSSKEDGTSNSEHAVHSYEWVTTEQTHIKKFTCGCLSPDIAEIHVDNNENMICDVCGYHITTVSTGSAILSVIMVNDNHGSLNEDQGGLDRIASGIEHYESQGNAIKIANGDMFQGTFLSSSLKGLPMLDALNELDFDAFVIGNHEFDWGLDEIKKYKDGDVSNGEAEFPFLGANIMDTDTGKMVDWMDAYTIVEVDGVRIGIIGVIGQVQSSILATALNGYEFLDAGEIVDDYAKELRTTKDCDVVIVAAHEDNYELNTTIASYTDDSRVDAIFTGHSHIPTDDEIKSANGTDICVLQNGGYGESFAVLTLTFDENGTLSDTDGTLIDTDQYNDEGSLNSVFNKYADQIAEGERVLFSIPTDAPRDEIGVLAVNEMFLKYEVDLAILNSGGVRSGISAGEVTYADIFKVFPFENEVYVMTISGEKMIMLRNDLGGYFWWGYDVSYFDPDKEYKLAVVDFVYAANYFDEYRSDEYIDTNDRIRDVFANRLIEELT